LHADKWATDDPAVGFRHRWDGLVARLRGNQEYRAEFKRVFGISNPTEDAVGKALATYLRTVLSGNSLYDRARQTAERGKRELQADDFAGALDEEGLERLAGKGATKAELAQKLMRGYGLFHGAAGCAGCHGGRTFTDNNFHNVGIRESGRLSNKQAGEQPGRFRRVPVGLKETRLIGAFRTPTLRNLPRTFPHFHDGQAGNLREVVDYYNDRLSADFNPFLDPLLRDGPQSGRRLGLTDDEVRALVLFLRALDGEPIPPRISERGRR
jgi:cytochrome c peroxidase